MTCDHCGKQILAVALVNNQTLCYKCNQILHQAAPKLFAALDLVVAQFEGIADDKWPTNGMQIAIEKARAALTEARGERGE
jgi:hypothetical protein